MVPFSLGFALVMLGIGLVLMLIFGSKNIIGGKYGIRKILTILFPFVVFALSYAITQEGTQAGIITMLVMVLLTALLILGIGLRSTFKF
jgi:hypothetical protein